MRRPWTGLRSSSATASSTPRTERPPTASCAGRTGTAILGVVDAPTAGRDAGEVLDGRARGIPIFGTLPEALRALGATPDFCVVGVATSGGRVTPGLRGLLAEAISLGMSVVNGLHEFVSDDPELAAAAAARGVTITDVRKTAKRTELHFWSGEIREVAAPRIAVLGTDCALGKRTTARFLLEACRRAGLKTELIFTGQTGWMQGAPFGFILDSIPNDFVSGELEHAVVSCWRAARPDLILFEGQSALRNPSGPCGSEFLLSGGARGVDPPACPGADLLRGPRGPRVSDPAAGRRDRAHRELRRADARGDPQRRASNARRSSAADQDRYRAELGLPVVRPLEEGVEELVPVVRELRRPRERR